MNGWQAVALVVFVVLVLVMALLVATAYTRQEVAGGRENASRESASRDTFPYWRYSLPPAAKMFQALKGEKLVHRGPKTEPVLERRYPRDYRRADALSNHFTEEARVDCRAGGRPTPREAWALVEARGNLPHSSAARREAVYDAGGAECNIFNPAFARWIIERTAGRGARVLDPSSGWGDRLIGALAAGAKEYRGCDPNPRLQPGYRRIVDTLGGGDHTSYAVAESPFEDLDLGGETFPLVMTSPPYYDYEVYVPPGAAGADSQSIGRWPDYESWAKMMYRPYVTKAYKAVAPGGWLVLYIEDVRVKGRVFPLRALTEDTLKSLGAQPAGKFGLAVRAGRKTPKTRWALAWRRPCQN